MMMNHSPEYSAQVATVSHKKQSVEQEVDEEKVPELFPPDVNQRGDDGVTKQLVCGRLFLETDEVSEDGCTNFFGRRRLLLVAVDAAATAATAQRL